MARSPKSVRHLLKDKPTLKRLELEISAQKALLARIRLSVPDDLALHCAAAQIQGRQLVLHTDSPAWATRLRYIAPQLLSLLRPDYPSMSEIKIKVLIHRSAAPPPRRPARKSDIAAAIIHDSALDTKPEPLRDALLRLSEALKRH